MELTPFTGVRLFWQFKSFQNLYGSDGSNSMRLQVMAIELV